MSSAASVAVLVSCCCCCLLCCVASSESIAYLGCFRDVSGLPRDLELAHVTSQATKDYCYRFCLVRGYRYFGMQAGAWCHCGNSYGRHGQAPDGECNHRCWGNRFSPQRCGGPWRTSVFTTGLAPKNESTPGMWHIGCFADAEHRDFHEEQQFLVSASEMTIGKCYSFCHGRGYQYMALQGGTECRCTNRFGRYGTRDSSECRTQCSGDKASYCGGPWRNSIYATGFVTVRRVC